MSKLSVQHTFIIAEAGVNHNGSIDMACALIDAATDADADAVKFQTFRASEVISRHAPKAGYQTRTTGTGESQLEMVRKLELSEAAHDTLIAHAEAKGIGFLSTPFDLPSLRLLTQRFGLGTIKISSGEITNAPFLLEIARTGRKVILSTGMSTLGEVEVALGVLAFGYTAADSKPDARAFAAAFATDAGQAALLEHVSLLHCTSEYPAPYREVNLMAIDTLSHAFGLPVGLSDHTPGIHVPVAAVARGARIIEKHFTLDRNLQGPDHAASLEPTELKAMVQAIRDIELTLGDGVKRPTASEWNNRDIVRKSLVAARTIRRGRPLRPEDLVIKRPGTGLSPLEYWDRLGQLAGRDYMIDDEIEP
jgi:N-acetylneuraminate synthase